MLATSTALAVLAVALAWPVPILLSRARWPARAPATALVLWQAIALAGGLSMLGALTIFGLAPLGPDLVGGGISFAASLSGDRPWVPVGPLHVLALSAAGLLGGHLLLNLLVTIGAPSGSAAGTPNWSSCSAHRCPTPLAPGSSTTLPRSPTACPGRSPP